MVVSGYSNMYAIRLKKKVNGKYYYFFRHGYDFKLVPNIGTLWVQKPISSSITGHKIGTHLCNTFDIDFDDRWYNTIISDFDLTKELGIVMPKDKSQWPSKPQLFDDLLEVVEVEFKEV